MRKMFLCVICFVFIFTVCGCANGNKTVEDMEYTLKIREWDETGLTPTEEFEVTGIYLSLIHI